MSSDDAKSQRGINENHARLGQQINPHAQIQNASVHDPFARQAAARFHAAEQAVFGCETAAEAWRRQQNAQAQAARAAHCQGDLAQIAGLGTSGQFGSHAQSNSVPDQYVREFRPLDPGSLDNSGPWTPSDRVTFRPDLQAGLMGAPRPIDPIRREALTLAIQAHSSCGNSDGLITKTARAFEAYLRGEGLRTEDAPAGSSRQAALLRRLASDLSGVAHAMSSGEDAATAPAADDPAGAALARALSR